MKKPVGRKEKIGWPRRKTGRWIVSWYDQRGTRRNPSFATLKEAEAFQKQKRAELERHRAGRFNLDDREMLSQARDLASTHRYTVLQAIQEWHSSKGSSKAMALGGVIDKFVAAKSSRSADTWTNVTPTCGYFCHISALTGQSTGLGPTKSKIFWIPKRATARRRNNLRSEIITLFKYAQIRLRALHRDRKTEAELVLRDQTKRKPVETFSPKEFQTFIAVVRPEWLPWLALGGLAGIRTDGEIFRITWECFKWDRLIMDLSTTMTKIDERRHVPLCDRLIDLLMPVHRESGPVINLKKPEDETARLQRVTGIRWRRNALRHSFYSETKSNGTKESSHSRPSCSRLRARYAVTAGKSPCLSSAVAG
jgi:hypothetical protein